MSLYLEVIFDQDETTDNQTKLNKYNLKQLICEFVIGSHFEYGKLHSETSKSHFTLPRLLKAYRAHSMHSLQELVLSVQTCGFINLARTGFECTNMWFHQPVSLYLEVVFNLHETTDNQTKLNKYK